MSKTLGFIVCVFSPMLLACTGCTTTYMFPEDDSEEYEDCVDESHRSEAHLLVELSDDVNVSRIATTGSEVTVAVYDFTNVTQFPICILSLSLDQVSPMGRDGDYSVVGFAWESPANHVPDGPGSFVNGILTLTQIVGMHCIEPQETRKLFFQGFVADALYPASHAEYDQLPREGDTPMIGLVAVSAIMYTGHSAPARVEFVGDLNAPANTITASE
jgi:hypothetical protein